MPYAPFYCRLPAFVRFDDDVRIAAARQVKNERRQALDFCTGDVEAFCLLLPLTVLRSRIFRDQVDLIQVDVAVNTPTH